MATFYGDNCWENGIVSPWNVALFQVRVASCDLGSLRDGKMEADLASSHHCHGGGACFFGLSEQGGEKKEPSLDDPELRFDNQREFKPFSLGNFRMQGPCFKAATLIKIHSLNKIYSLC